MNPAEVYRVFFRPQEVTEIRAYGLKGKGSWEGYAAGAGVVYGYFDNPESFGKAADSLEQHKAPGIYFTLNPCKQELLARAANRLKAAGQKDALTSDKDIKEIRWVPIDLDPIRPSGISSTQRELNLAIDLRDLIYRWIKEHTSWEMAVPGVSGNGAHLVCACRPWPNEEGTTKAIKNFLAALAKHFENDAINIDQKVFNPARIWKLYGTTARKGDHTQERPHRKSYIEPRWLEKFFARRKNNE